MTMIGVLSDHDDRREIIDSDNKHKWSIFNKNPIFHEGEETFPLCSPASSKTGSATIVVNSLVLTRNGQSNFVIEIGLPEKVDKKS